MIWVVADKESTRRTLSSLIGERGYEVDEIECSDDVPHRLHFRRPVLIIVDCEMKDSFDLVHRMRTDRHAGFVPIIMFSVSGDDISLRQQAILKGADAFVSKGSLDWVELFQQIRHFAGPPS
jgi:CheY-like chemotaxis protein